MGDQQLMGDDQKYYLPGGMVDPGGPRGPGGPGSPGCPSMPGCPGIAIPGRP